MPLNADNKREMGRYEFHYRGWQKSGTEQPYRSGASKENLFPPSRKGSLDSEVLKKLGLTSDRMKEDDGAPDSLFFYQLILPICDVSINGLEGDPRKSFYADVSTFTSLYAIKNLTLGRGYCHKYQLVEILELIRWDGCVVQDGV